MSKAAIELHRSHSAVSHSIHLLEDTLGISLFERTALGMLLTQAGRALFNRVQAALQEMNIARNALADAHLKHGTLARNSPIFTLAIGLRRLEILIACDQHPHMGAVAQNLRISQPAVSLAVRDLEASIGLSLLDRSVSALRLTTEAHVLISHLKKALLQLRLAQAELTNMQGILNMEITIGALPFGRTHILPAAISSLHEKHPLLRFSTVEAPIEVLTQRLLEGDIDFILGALHSTRPCSDLVREELFDDQLSLIVRAGHPFTGQARLTLENTLGAAWILPRRNTPTRTALRVIFESSFLHEPEATVESSDLSIIRGLLIGSDMITIASCHLFHPEIASGLLKSLPVHLPHAKRPVGVLRRVHGHSSLGVTLLIEEIRRLGNLPFKAFVDTRSA